MLKVEFDIQGAMLNAAIAIAVIALLLFLFDVHYFLRSLFVVISGKFFESKLHPEDVSTIYGICTTNDLDIMLRHMNNARFIRELDFARFHFYIRTGLHNMILKVGGNAFQTAAVIKYRRTIPLFTTYKITTKLTHWDEKSIYLEQQFISLNDGFVRAVCNSKQGIIGLNVSEAITKLLGKDPSYKLQPLPELEHFIECLDANSRRLRKKD